MESASIRGKTSAAAPRLTVKQPGWITHKDAQDEGKGKPKPHIYSLHIRPDETRLATAGQDAKVKIWNMEPVMDSQKAEDETVPKLLSCLTNHGGSVLCVRWSNGKGPYLASGSDDRVVMIWELDSSGRRQAAFGLPETTYEAWNPVRRLTGHGSGTRCCRRLLRETVFMPLEFGSNPHHNPQILDVTDLAWSHNNAFLASCGLDNAICIWDGITFEKRQRLELHSSYVKGLAWDPIGKYLCSQSDDRTARIWRTADWKVVATISKPFEKSPSTTFFSRPSWSPDGGQVAVVGAVNGSMPAVSIVKRDIWTSEISLLGHDDATEVACFNPVIFKKESEAGGSVGSTANCFACICAVGSQDKSISLWKTASSRPVMVIRDAAEHCIMDLTWHPNGHVLMASSYDGAVMFAQLDEGVFGIPCTPEEKAEQLDKVCGNQDICSVLPESTSQLALENDRRAQKRGELFRHCNPPALGEDSQPGDKNIETHVPVAKPNIPGATDSRIDIRSSDSPFPQPPTAAHTIAEPPQLPKSIPSVLSTGQQVTITKDGKKRIQPMLVGSLLSCEMPLSPQVVSATSVSHNGPAPRPPETHRPANRAVSVLDSVSFTDSRETMDRPVERQAPGIGHCLPTVVINTKRKHASDSSTEPTGSRTKRAASLLNPRHGNGVAVEVVRPTRLSGVSDISRVRIAVPKVMTRVVWRTTDAPAFEIDCDNTLRKNEGCKITCSSQGAVKWVDYLPSPVIALSGSAEHTITATEEASLYAWSPTGRRLFPCLMLDAPTSFLQSFGPYAMAITAVGLVYVWNVAVRRAVVSEVSVAPILKSANMPPDESTNSSVSIVGATVKLEDGTPSIVTSAGEAFTYHRDMRAWLRTADATLAASDHYMSWRSGGPFSEAEAHLGPVDALQAKASGATGELCDPHFALSLRSASDPDAGPTLTLRHIEIQLATALMLSSPKEYKHWLKIYASRLADENKFSQATELLMEHTPRSTWHLGMKDGRDIADDVLGIPKTELKREILPILAGNRNFQRLLENFI